MEKIFSFQEINLTRIMETAFHNKKFPCCSSIYLLIEDENMRQFVHLVGLHFLLNKACQWYISKTKKNGLLKQIFSQQKEPPVRERCALISYQEGTS